MPILSIRAWYLAIGVSVHLIVLVHYNFSLIKSQSLLITKNLMMQIFSAAIFLSLASYVAADCDIGPCGAIDPQFQGECGVDPADDTQLGLYQGYCPCEVGEPLEAAITYTGMDGGGTYPLIYPIRIAADFELQRLPPQASPTSTSPTLVPTSLSTSQSPTPGSSPGLPSLSSIPPPTSLRSPWSLPTARCNPSSSPKPPRQ